MTVSAALGTNPEMSTEQSTSSGALEETLDFGSDQDNLLGPIEQTEGNVFHHIPYSSQSPSSTKDGPQLMERLSPSRFLFSRAIRGNKYNNQHCKIPGEHIPDTSQSNIPHLHRNPQFPARRRCELVYGTRAATSFFTITVALRSPHPNCTNSTNDST
ncbi:uncharacterized protein LY89DRAFT_743341 [Mollisia scopiformis]|uniref:Uncharacterized protein n=1 Tax=Mollisia scopiformis TaxID=149040 RepID=A0A132B550_MOLSC|nr:uncharacterized protein LY89DRAFT_743341 [Mollisia scopiformis]KUJ07014.1 hypothetical protein LY89DRAFT_743341 [Mollisia scopiformis]